MSNNTLSLIIGVIAVIATVLILIFVKPRKRLGSKNEYKRPPNIKDDRSFLIDQYNQYLTLYNEVTGAVSSKIHSLSRLIELYHDADAFHKVNDIVGVINRKCSDIDDYLTRARNCLSNGDLAGANYCIAAIKADIELLKDYEIQLNNIDVKQGSQTKQSSAQTNLFTEQPVSIRFFQGCENKEEVTARYRSLSKALHPDSKGGDVGAFQEMSKEYEIMMKGFET